MKDSTPLLVLLLLLICIHHRSSAQQFSMQDAISYARENHDEVKKALLEIADADGNVKEFTSIGMPKISGNVQLQHFLDIPTSIIPAGSFFEGDPDRNIPPNPAEDLQVQFGFKNNLTAGLSADALLFDGSFFVGLQAAKFFKDLVAKQAEVTKENLGVSVAKAYLAVLVAEKNRALLQKNISNLEKTYDESFQIYREGFIEKLDLDRLDLSLNNLRVEDQKIQSLIEISKNVLKFSMGYPLDQEIELTQSFDDLLITEYESIALLDAQLDLKERTEYVALKAARNLNDLNIKRLKMQYIPTLRGFASYAQVLQGNNISGGSWFPTTIVGLTLDVPIFDGFEKRSKISRAKIEKEQHLVDLSTLEKGINLEVINARKAMANALKTVESTQKSEALAQNIYDTALIKYREGVGASLEVTQAESDLYAAQGNVINALYDLLVAKVDLEKALGHL